MPNLDNLLEAQAELEILTDVNRIPDKLNQFEQKLRNAVMEHRKNGTLTRPNIEQTILDLSDELILRTRVHYETITPAPDGWVMWVFEATVNSIHMFIHIRS